MTGDGGEHRLTPPRLAVGQSRRGEEAAGIIGHRGEGDNSGHMTLAGSILEEK